VAKEELIESYRFDSATEGFEPVLFVIKRLLDRLETRLLARGRAATALALRFVTDPNPDQDRSKTSKKRRGREQIEIPLARPMRSARTMLSLCREVIGGALSGAVWEVEIEAKLLVPEEGAQLDLFHQHARRIEEVEDLVTRLEVTLGEKAVFRAELRDTHRPEESWQPRPFEIARAFEPGPESGALRDKTRRAVHSLTRAMPREALPEVEDTWVVEPSAEEVAEPIEEQKPASRASKRRAQDWPKTVQRTIEQEPLPKLPARPLELLPEPERARLGATELLWREARLMVSGVRGRERFECEWWKDAPLDREYFIVEIEDGRRLWLFRTTSASEEVWVHGVFD
jgi:hypothetical protein